MPLAAALPLVLGLGSALMGLYAIRPRLRGYGGGQDAPDTPTTECIEQLEQAAGRPLSYSVSTLDSGAQLVSLPADDPMTAADAAHSAGLPAAYVIANLDGMSLDIIPHPKGVRGECLLYVLADGQLTAAGW